MIDPKQLKKVKVDIFEKKYTEINQVYNTLNIDTTVDKNIFAKAVFKVIIDFALNTDGKNSNAIRAAILPINKELKTLKLPGEEIEAFGGFASLKAKEYAFEFGRLSTLFSLTEKEEGYRKEHPFILENANVNLESKLITAINDIGFFGHNNQYEKDLKENLFELGVIRIKAILIQNKFLSFLMSKIPFAVSGLFSGPVLLWKSIFNKFPWRGNNVFKKLVNSGAKSINYLSLEPVIISIISDKKLKETLLVQCSDTGLHKKMEVLHLTGQ